MFIATNWSGQEPSEIAFSADSGNVATGLAWPVWNAATAIGHGTRIEQDCVPDCVGGSQTPYPVTITLSDPVDGQFASVVEVTADGRGTTDTFHAPYVGITAS